MSSDKNSKAYAGAPGAPKSPTVKVYDLFKTFRHAPANAKEGQADLLEAPADKSEK